MNLKWFIIVDGKQEGPFTLLQLKSHLKITPDTLVWREGFSTWIAVRNVKELNKLFEDEEEAQPIQERFVPKKKILDGLLQDEETMVIGEDPYQFWLWILVIILIIVYVIYQINS